MEKRRVLVRVGVQLQAMLSAPTPFASPERLTGMSVILPPLGVKRGQVTHHFVT